MYIPAPPSRALMSFQVPKLEFDLQRRKELMADVASITTMALSDIYTLAYQEKSYTKKRRLLFERMVTQYGWLLTPFFEPSFPNSFSGL
jgi:hypothetical protein